MLTVLITNSYWIQTAEFLGAVSMGASFPFKSIPLTVFMLIVILIKKKNTKQWHMCMPLKADEEVLTTRSWQNPIPWTIIPLFTCISMPPGKAPETVFARMHRLPECSDGKPVHSIKIPIQNHKDCWKLFSRVQTPRSQLILILQYQLRHKTS